MFQSISRENAGVVRFQGICNKANNSDIIIILKTKLNVIYDAGQWFHITENYLPHHSFLENNNMLVSAKRIFFIFDKG
jgi:hypothetical protein